MKWKAFSIIFEGLSSKQIKKMLEVESPTLNRRADGDEPLVVGDNDI